MANKVCCDEVKVESTIDLNDRDYLNDILSSFISTSQMQLVKDKFNAMIVRNREF